MRSFNSRFQHRVGSNGNRLPACICFLLAVAITYIFVSRPCTEESYKEIKSSYNQASKNLQELLDKQRILIKESEYWHKKSVEHEESILKADTEMETIRKQIKWMERQLSTRNETLKNVMCTVGFWKNVSMTVGLFGEQYNGYQPLDNAPAQECAKKVCQLSMTGVSMYPVLTSTNPAFWMLTPNPDEDHKSEMLIYRTIMETIDCNQLRYVIDVGAHLGYFSLFAAKFDCHVVAFEERDDLSRLIELSAEMNNIPASNFSVYKTFRKGEALTNLKRGHDDSLQISMLKISAQDAVASLEKLKKLGRVDNILMDFKPAFWQDESAIHLFTTLLDNGYVIRAVGSSLQSVEERDGSLFPTWKGPAISEQSQVKLFISELRESCKQTTQCLERIWASNKKT